MISSIFGKTKPISSVILFSFLFVLYWLVYFGLFKVPYAPEVLLLQLGVLIVLLFSLFLVNFIVSRNKITGANSFTILLFSCFVVLFPEALKDNNAIFCSFFLLLGFRRIISLKSLKTVKLKIYDATLWIGIASLFYNWAILFLILVYVAIYFYDAKNIRNWLIPFSAIGTLLLVSFWILSWHNELSFYREHYTFNVRLNFNELLDWHSNFRVLLYILVTVIFMVVVFIRQSQSSTGKAVVLRFLGISLGVTVLVSALMSSQGMGTIMLTFFPSAVLCTNYIETIKRRKLKEVVLIAFIVIPVVTLVLQFLYTK